MRPNRAGRLFASGIRGRAQILEMTQTGTYLNNQPRVKMRLRIDAPGVATFQDEDTVTVPLIALGALQPGRPLVVVLDPADPKKYVIDWAGNSDGPAMTFSTKDGRGTATASLPGGNDSDPGIRLTKLTELRDSGKISAAEFEEHKRRILSDI